MDWNEGLTVAALIEAAAGRLAAAKVVCAHGTASHRDEAAFIIYQALGFDHSDPAVYRKPVDRRQARRIEDLINTRITRRMPAAYLLGEAWFAGLSFEVDARVLIPRSPFAELIARRFAPWLPELAAPRILEIGTGSACIAIACALAFPQSEVVATDVSWPALEVARRNVIRHGVSARVTLLQADLLCGIRGVFDLIISNPPYVPDAELEDMPPEFCWEPRQALAGGRDGLAQVRRILQDAFQHLAPGGLLAVEVGGGAATLEAAFPAVPFIWPEFEAGGDGIALVSAAGLGTAGEPLHGRAEFRRES